MPSTTGATFRFGDHLLCAADTGLVRDGVAVPLPPKALGALLLLVEGRGRLVAKDEFFARLWADTVVEEVTLAHTITLLRKALGDSATAPRFIETVPKRGYRFLVSVESVADDGGPRRPVVAVLPFANLSPDAKNDYLADGITEEILNLLAQHAAIKVIARSSTFAFKGVTRPLAQVAEQLHADVVVEGSVRRAGDTLRITAQLVAVADGCSLWSSRFDRDLADIFAVQDEIAGAVARRLLDVLDRGAEPTSPVSDARSRGNMGSISLEAYDEYLKGRQQNHRRVQGMWQARTHFERALALDGSCAAAHACLAQTCCWFGHRGGSS